jgi:hypothetical protein
VLRHQEMMVKLSVLSYELPVMQDYDLLDQTRGKRDDSRLKTQND